MMESGGLAVRDSPYKLLLRRLVGGLLRMATRISVGRSLSNHDNGRCVTTSNPEVRAEAAEALGKFARRGAKVEAAESALRQATQDPHSRVRREAAEALSLMAPRRAGEALLKEGKK
jgi:HEAT repeat protein